LTQWHGIVLVSVTGALVSFANAGRRLLAFAGPADDSANQQHAAMSISFWPMLRVPERSAFVFGGKHQQQQSAVQHGNQLSAVE